MRLLLAFACLLVAIPGPVMAQEPVKDFDIAKYAAALSRFAGRMAQSRQDFDTSRWMGLASQDQTLAKAPTVKAQTISIIQKLGDLDAALKQNKREQELAERRISALQPTYVNGKPTFTVTRQMAEKKLKLEQELRDLQKAAQDLRNATGQANAQTITQLTALASTTEGRQFAMPDDSMFLELISPRENRTAAPVEKQKPKWISLPVEVVSPDAEGFHGYELKPRTNAGAPPPGSLPPGQARPSPPPPERLRSVYVRGYTNPVKEGQFLFIRVLAGELKVENGTEIQEFIFAKAP